MVGNALEKLTNGLQICDWVGGEQLVNVCSAHKKPKSFEVEFIAVNNDDTMITVTS